MSNIVPSKLSKKAMKTNDGDDNNGVSCTGEESLLKISFDDVVENIGT